MQGRHEVAWKSLRYLVLVSGPADPCPGLPGSFEAGRTREVDGRFVAESSSPAVRHKMPDAERAAARGHAAGIAPGQGCDGSSELDRDQWLAAGPAREPSICVLGLASSRRWATAHDVRFCVAATYTATRACVIPDGRGDPADKRLARQRHIPSGRADLKSERYRHPFMPYWASLVVASHPSSLRTARKGLSSQYRDDGAPTASSLENSRSTGTQRLALGQTHRVLHPG
jgi:hypothetical protein